MPRAGTPTLTFTGHYPLTLLCLPDHAILCATCCLPRFYFLFTAYYRFLPHTRRPPTPTLQDCCRRTGRTAGCPPPYLPFRLVTFDLPYPRTRVCTGVHAARTQRTLPSAGLPRCFPAAPCVLATRQALPAGICLAIYPAFLRSSRLRTTSTASVDSLPTHQPHLRFARTPDSWTRTTPPTIAVL